MTQGFSGDGRDEGHADADRPVVHLASGNPHKAREMQRLADASALALRVVPAVRMPPVAEDAGTFVGNARKKAQALRGSLPAGAWVLADDSGLCVDALGGAPGVESAYYAGPAADGAANLRKLVAAMAGVPPGRRGAHFVCVLFLLTPDGREHVFEGRCAGMLGTAPAGGGGFGYDPLFIPAGHARTYAELPEDEKNRISHRARAWEQFAAWWRGARANSG